MSHFLKYHLLAATILVTCQAMAKGKDVFTFGNGNTLSHINKDEYSNVAVFDRSGKQLSKDRYLSRLTNLIHGKYTLFPVKSENLLMVFAKTKLFIVDQEGMERLVDVNDALLTTYLEIPNEEILLTGSHGHLYKINLKTGQKLTDQEISRSTLSLHKTRTNKMFLLEGLTSVSKVHFLNQELQVNLAESVDTEKELQTGVGFRTGPFEVFDFENGALAAIHSKGGILFINSDNSTITLKGSAVSSSTSLQHSQKFEYVNELDKLGTAFYVGNDFTINLLEADGSFRQHTSDLDSLSQLKTLNLDNKAVIDHANVGCINTYREWLKIHKKQMLLVNGIVGATMILNPIVGAGGLIIANSDVFARWSEADHVALVMKILNDAESGQVTPEIQMIAKPLIEFDSTRYPDAMAILNALRELNQNGKACEKTSTLRDLMYILIKTSAE